MLNSLLLSIDTAAWVVHKTMDIVIYQQQLKSSIVDGICVHNIYRFGPRNILVLRINILKWGTENSCCLCSLD